MKNDKFLVHRIVATNHSYLFVLLLPYGKKEIAKFHFK